MKNVSWIPSEIYYGHVMVKWDSERNIKVLCNTMYVNVKVLQTYKIKKRKRIFSKEYFWNNGHNYGQKFCHRVSCLITQTVMKYLWKGKIIRDRQIEMRNNNSWIGYCIIFVGKGLHPVLK